MNNVDEKAFIASSMSQVLEILEMLTNVTTKEMRVILNPNDKDDKGKYINCFLLKGGMNQGIINNIMLSLKQRLSELEINYFNLNKGSKDVSSKSNY